MSELAAAASGGSVTISGGESSVTIRDEWLDNPGFLTKIWMSANAVFQGGMESSIATINLILGALIMSLAIGYAGKSSDNTHSLAFGMLAMPKFS